MKQADWNHNILNEIDPALVESAAAPAKKHSLRPVRIAVAGKLVTPGGAVELCHILGREETVRRLKKGIEKLQQA